MENLTLEQRIAALEEQVQELPQKIAEKISIAISASFSAIQISENGTSIVFDS